MTDRPDSTRPRMRGGIPLATAGLAAVIVGIGWMDFVTGPRIGFSLFYLLPVAFAAWRFGTWSTTVLAVEAAATWFWADLALLGPSGTGVSVWNGTTRLAIYLAIGLLIAKVRRDGAVIVEMLEHSERMARTDALTGLPNTRAFYEHLRSGVSAGDPPEFPLWIADIDADNFKTVNDGFGHEAGDAVLKEIGRAIRENIRGEDFAARLGGDEFAVIFHGLDMDSAEEAVRRIVASVRELGIKYPESELGASVGLARLDSVSGSLENALRMADEAMYEAKRGGKGRVVVARTI